MLNKLKAKLKKQGGFTLIEMLIVVAIIAILIAISIPLVNGALEKARDATDQANERAAKAEILLYFMGVTDQASLTKVGGGTAYVPGTALTAKYDAVNGELLPMSNTTLKAYGQCTGGADCYKADSDSHIGDVIKVDITANGAVTISWITPATTT